MSAVTRVDAVVARLLTLYTEATGLQVEDGPAVGEVAMDAIVVGMPASDDEPGYTTTATRSPGMGGRRYTEVSQVRSMLTISDGSTNAAGVRDRCAGYLRQIDAELREHQVVDDVWQRVELAGPMQWLVLQTVDGVTCTVFFTVEAESNL